MLTSRFGGAFEYKDSPAAPPGQRGFFMRISIVDRGSWIVDRGSWIVDRGS
jgi:hypothetical protein